VIQFPDLLEIVDLYVLSSHPAPEGVGLVVDCPADPGRVLLGTVPLMVFHLDLRMGLTGRLRSAIWFGGQPKNRIWF
jgi:hypothetical protein